jgi:outer membrane protein
MSAATQRARRAVLPAAIVLAVAATASAQEPLTLGQAEQRALANHPEVKLGEYVANAASEVVRETRSAYFPTVFGSVTGAGAEEGTRITAGALNNPTILSRAAAGVAFGQLITDFGRTGDLVASSRLRADAQRTSIDAYKADVLLQVDGAYFDVLRADAVRRVSEETVSARQLVVDQITALANANLKSALDVSFAQVNLSEAQLMLVAARNDLQSASARLAAAMGLTSGSFRLAEEPLPEAPPADSAPLVAEALAKRPDVVAERQAAQAAAKFADAERALFFPTVAAAGAAGVTPYRPDGLNDHYAAVGVNVNVPLTNGDLFGARRAEARLRAEAENERVRDVENRITRDVTTAWLEVRTAYQRLDLTAQLLAQSSDALELAQSRYNLGLSSIVELTQAQLNKTRAEIEQASARYDYQARSAALRYQLGRLP